MTDKQPTPELIGPMLARKLVDADAKGAVELTYIEVSTASWRIANLEVENAELRAEVERLESELVKTKRTNAELGIALTEATDE